MFVTRNRYRVLEFSLAYVGICLFAALWHFPGGARHDLGLYESLLSFVIFIVMAIFFKRLIKRGPGFVSGLSLALYAVVRFFLDFLRATDLPGSDARYGHLTPAQWGMIGVVAVLTA